MNTLEGKAWQALAAVDGIGAKALWQIAEFLHCQGKTASWLLKNREQAGGAWKGIKLNAPLPDPDVLNGWEGGAIEEQEVTVLHPLHPGFPGRIRDLKDRLILPAILYAAGNLSILKRPGVAVVGRRDAGPEPRAVAEELAFRLAAGGINVISGYAPGIDSAAHLGALRSKGTTTMVLAEGLDHFQVKPEFRGLVTDANALVVSQFSTGSTWAAYRAMARNKLVAALSAVMVVVVSGPEHEAGGRMSGTFDAGASALKLGLTLFVADPAFFPSLPAGNQQLIARGGRPWNPSRGIEPILAAMGPDAQEPGQKKLF